MGRTCPYNGLARVRDKPVPGVRDKKCDQSETNEQTRGNASFRRVSVDQEVLHKNDTSLKQSESFSRNEAETREMPHFEVYF